MSIISKNYTFSAGAVIVAAEHNSNFDTIYSDYDGNITNANLSASAAIALSKISFTTALAMSGAIIKPAKGADVASTAGTITLGEDGNQFDITGTAAITSITAKTAGTLVYLQFDSTASLVDGSNLKINGNFTGAAESTITLYCDGTNWYELSRSPISAALSAASQAEMEAASSTTVYVTPGRTQYHPGVAKAWVNFQSNATINASYNITSVVNDSTGQYTITFDTDFSGGFYVMTGSAKRGSAGALVVCVKTGTTPAAGSIIIETRRTDDVLENPTEAYIVFFGDQ